MQFINKITNERCGSQCCGSHRYRTVVSERCGSHRYRTVVSERCGSHGCRTVVSERSRTDEPPKKLFSFFFCKIALFIFFMHSFNLSAQNDSQYEFGVKGITKTSIVNLASLSPQNGLNHLEVFGRIPVKSIFSINIGTGFHFRRAENREGNTIKESGTFLKLGLNKAFGKGKGAAFLLGINYIGSYMKHNDLLVYEDSQELWEPAERVISENKFANSFELELGYEVKLGKSNLYIGSSFIFNTGFDPGIDAFEDYRVYRMPGISGITGQEYVKIHLINLSYKWNKKPDAE